MFQEFLDNFPIATVFPIAVLLFLAFFFIYYANALRPQRGTAEWVKMRAEARGRTLSLLKASHPLTKTDILPLAIITVVFAILAVFNLGSGAPVDILSEIAEPTEGRTHYNNLYFDEIYFVRSAAEHIHHIFPYEWTHPPLGKNIIAASILIFGESPLGWRLIGALCGALMVVAMYILIKKMFGKTAVAACGALLLGFDFCRLVQSRIGTIDTYTVLFILLAYLFMYKHMTTDPDKPFCKSLAPLALSGLFFGLSFSVKWTGFYAGAGLLVIYVIRLVHLWMHYNKTTKRGFSVYLTKTLLFSVLFFVIVPAIIYYLNYIPYGLARGMTLEGGMLWSRQYFEIVWSNQISMFSYHANLDATHGGSSFWWQWILDIKPILFVSNHKDGLRSTFGSFGNPVLYWGGFAAMVVMAVRVFTQRDGKALFILIGYLAALLPWVAVTRVVFAYHYLPSTLFLVLAMSHIFDTMFERGIGKYRAYVYGFTGVTGGAFAMFYPILAGVFLPHWYYSYFAKWLPSWPF